jgi:hypothetical protein
LDCASPSHSPPPPGLARGWREGGRTAGHGLRFTAALTAVPGPGPWVVGGGWTAGLDCASLPPSPPSPGLARGWREGGGLLDLDYDSPPPSSPSPGVFLDQYCAQLAPAAGRRLLPDERTSSTTRRRTSTASHHALRGRPSCPLRSENGKVRKKQAHNGGLSRLVPLRPAGPRGWQARPALCWPPPGTWPRLGVGGR